MLGHESGEVGESGNVAGVQSQEGTSFSCFGAASSRITCRPLYSCGKSHQFPGTRADHSQHRPKQPSPSRYLPTGVYYAVENHRNKLHSNTVTIGPETKYDLGTGFLTVRVSREVPYPKRSKWAMSPVFSFKMLTQ